MKNMIGIILLIIIVIIICLIGYYLVVPPNCNENMIDIKPIDNPNYSRSQCIYKMNETLKNVFDEDGIKYTSSQNGNIYIPCAYDEINKEIKNIDVQNNDARVHIIHNADYLSAKDYLWNQIVNSAGLDKAKTMMPNTYILRNNNDRNRLLNDYKKGNIYIMKKNIQRQEGLKITDSLDDILNAEPGFVLAQELLQDPYTINVSQNKNKRDDRKINLRFYILIVCHDNNMDIYVYNNGFMYYAKKPFEKNSTEGEPNITTGYIERWVYENNPLTHEQFREYLDNPNRPLNTSEHNIKSQGLQISNIVFNRIHNLLRDIMVTIIGKVCEGDKLRQNVSFQLFGADIAINDQLWPMLMEVNKGPSLVYMDDGEDMKIKKSVVRDMIKIISGLKDKEPNGFLQIINKEGNRLEKVCM